MAGEPIIAKPLRLKQSTTKVKPFLKWVGGKSQIIDAVTSRMPNEMNNYHEPFLGGGSVLFALLDLVSSGEIVVHGEICAYDLNSSLIHVYKNVQKHPQKIKNQVDTIMKEFNEITGAVINRKPKNIDEAKTSKESYYFYLRIKYNNIPEKEKSSITASALFIILNKTCFRGMFREGPNGFNVPYGNYKSVEVFNQDIFKISDAIKGVKFTCCDFDKALECVEPGDFVYLDPPYAPINENSFVGYTKYGFDVDQHKKLFKALSGLKDTPAMFEMSNAETPFVLESFFDTSEYTVRTIECRRAINSKNPESKANEVIITNFNITP